MALDTVSISDIGTSLVAIETEIKSNCSGIDYHRECIKQYQHKNTALKELAQCLVKTAVPITLGNSLNGGDY